MRYMLFIKERSLELSRLSVPGQYTMVVTTKDRITDEALRFTSFDLVFTENFNFGELLGWQQHIVRQHMARPDDPPIRLDRA